MNIIQHIQQIFPARTLSIHPTFRAARSLLLVCTLVLALAPVTPAAGANSWQPLFNGKDLAGWDTYLAPPPGQQKPLGLNNDPARVFTIVQTDGAPAIRISGEIYGAITTHQQFDNFHFRLEFKWGPKRWPPRENVGRDSGILYCCVGPHGAGSQSWMRSVECNIMEKGTGQWWSVANAIIDVEGEWLTPALAPSVPYKMESPGERIIVYRPGAPRITARPSDGITPSFDDEKPLGHWNSVEVIFWGGNCIHLLNGEVNMVLTHPRYSENGRTFPLLSGKIQLQSEAAEVFYRKIEIKPLDELPSDYLSLVPSIAADETGFKSLLDNPEEKNWRQAGPGKFSIENGIATGQGGMGLWWYSAQTFTNFVLRGEFLQEQPDADSGVFVRFPDPGIDPWVAVHKGHEMEIGDAQAEKPTWRTGAIYPFHPPALSNVKPPGQWNEYEITCVDHNYSIRMNGRLINTWTDREKRTASGYIGLQNYNDGKTIRHRKLRIRSLP